MLVPLVLAVQLLGVSKTCTNGMPCTLSITITATIVSSSTLSMDTTPLEMEGAYAMTVEAIDTGIPDAKTIKERYLVFDAYHGQSIMVAKVEGGVEIKTINDALVVVWPERYELPKRRALKAIAAAYRRSEQRGQVVVARIQRRLVIAKS